MRECYEALIVHEKTRRNSVVGESGLGCNIRKSAQKSLYRNPVH